MLGVVDPPICVETKGICQVFCPALPLNAPPFLSPGGKQSPECKLAETLTCLLLWAPCVLFSSPHSSEMSPCFLSSFGEEGSYTSVRPFLKGWCKNNHSTEMDFLEINLKKMYCCHHRGERWRVIRAMNVPHIKVLWQGASHEQPGTGPVPWISGTSGVKVSGRKNPHLKEHIFLLSHRARNRRRTHEKFKKVNSYRDTACGQK